MPARGLERVREKVGGYGFAVGCSAIPLSLQPLTHSLSLVQLVAAYGVAT